MPDKSTIIFRADGGRNIGMGHFSRSLALAEMLKEHFHCIYATRTPSEYQINEIKRVCHELIELPSDEGHFKVFLNHLKGNEIVVLDNYFFLTAYQKSIRSKGCRLVCIDDTHDKHFVADVVINHAEGIEPSLYSIEPHTQLLLGLKYALLRKEFRMFSKQEYEKEFSCLIIMGGADPYNFTDYLLQLISNINLSKKVAVVSPSMPKHKDIVWYQKLTATEISLLMGKSEFGIFPASTVAIEACAKRLPFICGYFVDNQIEIYKGIEHNNLAFCVGNYHLLSEKHFTETVFEIMNPNNISLIQHNQSKFVDNKSNKRFLEIFKAL